MKKYSKKIIKILVLLVGISVITVSSGRILNYNLDFKSKPLMQSSDLPDNLLFVKELADDFSHYIHDTVTDRYDVYNTSGNREFYVMLSSPYCDDIRGWGGSIPFALVVDNDDKIIKMHLLPNYETPSWIDGLKEKNFFQTWDGLTLSEALEKEVDAITGSTMTCDAIIESMNRRLSIYTEVEESKKKSNYKKIIGILVSTLVLLFALLSFLYPKKLGKFRIALLLATVAVFGFWKAEFLSMALLANWLINGMSPASNIVLFSILVLSIILPLFTNKSFYCQYVCPYGSAQELMGKLPIKKITLGGTIIKILNPIKFILLFIITLILVLQLDIVLENFEPFSAFQFQFASLTVLVIAIVMLVLSIFSNKPWCRFFCPTGALLSMLRAKVRK